MSGNIMSFKEKLENMILSRSNSYKFYKEQYEKNSLPKNENPEIEARLTEMKKELNTFKRVTDNQMESISYLLGTAFFDYQLNEPINVLKNIQDLSSELLLFVSEVCSKNEITWWLDFGTLLGAVRHENFIPWDDEIDIAMMRSDYFKFVDKFNDEISDKGLTDIVCVDYINKEQNSEHIKGSLKISINHPDCVESSLSVLNVFVYDYIGEYTKKVLKKEYKKCKNNFFKDLDNSDLKSSLDVYYESLNLSYEQDDFIIPGIDRSKYDDDFFIFTTSKVFPLKKVRFGDNEFYAPNTDKHYLKKLYNDYYNLPKIISIPVNVDKFRYNFDSPRLFGECIDRLNEVNND